MNILQTIQEETDPKRDVEIPPYFTSAAPEDNIPLEELAKLYLED